jgi:hypothetical protein
MGQRRTIPQITASSHSRCHAPEHHRTHRQAPSTICPLAPEATLVVAILSLAGCTDERGTHREPLSARFGEAASHIAERTEALARILREGVSSAWFEIAVESSSVTPIARGKGRPRDVWPSCRAFDSAVMENMYAGYGNKKCGVLCTVAFGLSVVKRRKGGEIEEDRQPSYLGGSRHAEQG